MSFFSTSNIISSFVSGDLVKTIIANPGFKKGLENIDIKEYFSDDVIEDIIQRIFKHQETKKHLRKMILGILSNMGVEDAVK